MKKDVMYGFDMISSFHGKQEECYFCQCEYAQRNRAL